MTTAIAAGIVHVAFCWMLVLGVVPRLHEQIHSDANRVEHTCGVTLLSSGSCDHSITPAFVSPRPVALAARSAVYESADVAPLFLGASIFEHAPPALS